MNFLEILETMERYIKVGYKTLVHDLSIACYKDLDSSLIVSELQPRPDYFLQLAKLRK
jgi:hypothetical protein